jgi:hypothetical protein
MKSRRDRSPSNPSPVPRSGHSGARTGVALVALAATLLLASCSGADHRSTPQGPTATTDPGTGTGTGGSDGGGSVEPVPDDVATTVDPGTLPQTRDHPGTTNAQFTDGVQAMWQGIVDDDPQAAMPFFFPLSAYLQVKAIHDPTHDWQTRLVAAYTRDIHALHASLAGKGAEATLVGLDVPDGAARWVNPGEEYNKLGYWRVYGSMLRYTVGGQTLKLPIYSLISWRGEWYVVHVTHP